MTTNQQHLFIIYKNNIVITNNEFNTFFKKYHVEEWAISRVYYIIINVFIYNWHRKDVLITHEKFEI